MSARPDAYCAGGRLGDDAVGAASLGTAILLVRGDGDDDGGEVGEGVHCDGVMWMRV